MTGSSFVFLRVRGIEIGAHWSWLFVFALVSWSLSAQLFPRTYPGLGGNTYLVMGITAAFIFFGSILLHELGHAFRAIREGMKIEGITLWLFGGVARFSGMFPSAGAEFRIAIAGPIVSVFLAGAFGVIAWAGGGIGLPEAAVTVADYLARINAIVVGFNMVPALPLDGGRVLRSWLWHRQGSFSSATRTAAGAGKAFGFVLVGLGVLSFFSQAVTGGIWFVFLGWFLIQAAEAEAAFAMIRRAFRGLKVRDLMTPDPVVVSPSTSIEDFVELVRTHRRSTYPVVESGRLVGLMPLRAAAAVDTQRRPFVPVSQVMTPREEVTVVDPNVPMIEALADLRGGLGRAVVVEDGRVSGILSVSDVSRAIEVEELRPEPEPARRGAGIVVWVVIVMALGGAAGAFYRPPLIVVSPGPAVDVSDDFTIEGVSTSEINGEYLLSSVQVHQPTGLEALYALVHPDRNLILLSQLIPADVEPEDFDQQQREIFDESRMIAATAAAQAAGLEVSISGKGAEVFGVLPGAAAAEVLRRGDVIVAVDGRPVNLAQELRDVVSARPPGTTFQLTIQRDGEQIEAQVRSARFPSPGEGFVGIGIYVQTRDLDVDLPFEVVFAERNVGGPSAGFAYALAIADALDPADYAEGRKIAATGTIELTGEVGPVGGVGLKAVGVGEAGADIFLVPLELIGQVSEPGLSVRGVRNLRDALGLLRPS